MYCTTVHRCITQSGEKCRTLKRRRTTREQPARQQPPTPSMPPDEWYRGSAQYTLEGATNATRRMENIEQSKPQKIAWRARRGELTDAGSNRSVTMEPLDPLVEGYSSLKYYMHRTRTSRTFTSSPLLQQVNARGHMERANKNSKSNRPTPHIQLYYNVQQTVSTFLTSSTGAQQSQTAFVRCGHISLLTCRPAEAWL